MAGGFLDDAEQTFVNINRLDRDLEKGTYSKLRNLSSRYGLSVRDYKITPS